MNPADADPQAIPPPTRPDKRLLLAAGLCVVALLLLLPIRQQTTAGRIASIIGLPLLMGWLVHRGVVSLAPLRPFLLPAAALLGVSIASASFSMVPAYSFKALVLEAIPFQLVFAGTLLWLSYAPRHREVFAWAAAASALVVGTWTVSGYLFGFSISEVADSAGNPYRRAIGPYDSWARTSQFAVLLVPLVSAWALVQWQRHKPLVAAALVFVALLLSGAMVVTQVRSAWPAWLVATLLLLSQIRWRVALAVCVAGACLGLLYPGVRMRLQAIPRDIQNPDLLSSGRLSLWKTGWEAIRDRPLLGVGYGADVFLQPAVRERYPLVNPGDPERRQPDVHNVFLQQVAEKGVLGGAACAWYAIVWFRRWWSTRRPSTPQAALDEDRLFALGAGAGVVGLLVLGMGFNFYEHRNAFLFWMMAAAACAPLVSSRADLRASSPGSPSGQGPP